MCRVAYVSRQASSGNAGQAASLTGAVAIVASVRSGSLSNHFLQCLLLVALHSKFRFQAVEIPIDRGNREHAVTALVCHRTILRLKRTVYFNGIPILRMADIVNGDVIMLAPEKRHRIKTLTPAEHVSRRHLALALRHDPMFNADTLA